MPVGYVDGPFLEQGRDRQDDVRIGNRLGKELLYGDDHLKGVKSL